MWRFAAYGIVSTALRGRAWGTIDNQPGGCVMGIVCLHGWKRRHARAPARSAERACIFMSASDVTPRTPRFMASPATAGQRFAGMPRLRQLLTTVDFNESAFATSEVPPNASISESDVMSERMSTYCGYVNVHTSVIAFEPTAQHSSGMARRYEPIGKRLAQLRKVLGISQAELCRQIKCTSTRWNNYETGDRRITLPIAMKLADEYGASLDWIYRDERGGLPMDLRTRLNKAA